MAGSRRHAPFWLLLELTVVAVAIAAAIVPRSGHGAPHPSAAATATAIPSVWVEPTRATDRRYVLRRIPCAAGAGSLVCWTTEPSH